MLSQTEKNALYDLIAATIGSDEVIKSYKSSFNENTVTVVEKMVKANLECNSNMKKLLESVVEAGKLTSKGWLKKSLGAISSALKSSKLKGYGCLVATKSRWKTKIVASTI